MRALLAHLNSVSSAPASVQRQYIVGGVATVALMAYGTWAAIVKDSESRVCRLLRCQQRARRAADPAASRRTHTRPHDRGQDSARPRCCVPLEGRASACQPLGGGGEHVL